jgi:hypothetical protein
VNTVQLNQQMPLGLSDLQRDATLNNRMASALAASDPRYQMKRLDRAGLSRGAGQRAQADLYGAQDLTRGITDAYSQAMADTPDNLEFQSGQERQALALQSLQQQNAYANQMARLQMAGTLLGGLLG